MDIILFVFIIVFAITAYPISFGLLITSYYHYYYDYCKNKNKTLEYLDIPILC